VQGAQAAGPIARRKDLGPALAAAIHAVRAGAVYVLDVRVVPDHDEKIGAGEGSASRRASEPKRG
jgi:hypothetical protein